jgi:hypothetical protein
MKPKHYFVMIDSCAVDRFAKSLFDPVMGLRDTEFKLGFTPDLKQEYENALREHVATCHEARDLIRRILSEGTVRGFFGFGGPPYSGWNEGDWIESDQVQLVSRRLNEASKNRPGKRTDLHLVALAKHDIVITANTKENHWKQAPKGEGRIIQWHELEFFLAREVNLVSALRRLL